MGFPFMIFFLSSLGFRAAALFPFFRVEHLKWDYRACQTSQTGKETWPFLYLKYLFCRVSSCTLVSCVPCESAQVSGLGVFNSSQEMRKSIEEKCEWNYLVSSGFGALTWFVKHPGFTKVKSGSGGVGGHRSRLQPLKHEGDQIALW